MIIRTGILDCFSKASIELEDGKEYIVYIASCFASSSPIVQLYSKYNPIFICAEDAIDAPKRNFVTLNSKSRGRIESGNADFSKLVSHSKFIGRLLAALKKHQGDVWVKTFKNNLDFKPLFNDHVKSLGLTPEQSHKWNNKIEQYSQFSDYVPIADFVITTKDEAVNHFNELASSSGVVTSLPRNGQGEGVRVHVDKASLKEYLDKITDDPFVVMKDLSVKSAPSIEILIANKDEILVYGLVQQILDGVVCLGATYPTNLSQQTISRCHDIARKVGVKLAKDGLRGVVGIDFIIDDDDKVYFCELNARYTGVTHNRMLALKQNESSSDTSIIDLEIMALREGTFNGLQTNSKLDSMFWYKKEIYPRFSGRVRSLNIGNDILQLVQSGTGHVVVGQHFEGEYATKDKTSLGNLICIGKTQEDLSESIRVAGILIEQYMPVELKLAGAA